MTHPGNGNVLVVRNPAGWSFPAGGVEEGETLSEAAVRETREEASVEIEPTGVVAVIERDLEGRPELWVVFSARYLSGEPAPQAGDPVTEARWVAPADADRLLAWYPEKVTELVGRTPVRYTVRPQ